MNPDRKDRNKQREKALKSFQEAVEIPMLALGAVWLLLLIGELFGAVSPWMSALGNLIWAVFIAEFLAELALAADKARLLRTNWLAAVSLLVPALRILRIVRVVPFLSARSIQLLRVLSRINRNIGQFSHSIRKRGVWYVLLITFIVVFTGSSAVYFFERGNPEFNDYGTALWWAAMMITTMGSDVWPKSAEGRVLAFLMAVYSFSIFGYFTALVAAFFIGDKGQPESKSQANGRPPGN